MPDDIRLTQWSDDVEHTVGLRRLLPWDRLSDVCDRTFPALSRALEDAGVRITGPPYARYRDSSDERFDVELGFPVEEAVAPGRITVAVPVGGSLETGGLPRGRAVEAVHVGPHGTLPLTYAHMEEWARARGLEPSDQLWEYYEIGPDTDPDPRTWRTRVFMPVRASVHETCERDTR
ncbi:GyrI-like domain-containing protein [Cellulosimicrobium cellulans]|uniref:GyrI-like domain-containing protein n=1 Tax=Cellulosimicrobium cellulans TaxID=1710 RepID=UPI001EDB39D6|nr:GyrI-like domain-containing protein [Cellulosimicrobium cellulans]UKJ64966.1 GyrI-like domain-containing protein [Cellulosimicrobium cellulans]